MSQISGMPSLRLFASACALLVVLPCCSAQLSYTAPQSIATGFQRLSGYAVGDFNGDGKPDLALTDGFDKRVVVYLNDGTGGFAPPISTYLSISNTAGSLTVGDVNEDGKQDLVIGTISGADQNIRVLLGKGDGTFTMGSTLPNSFGYETGKLVDLNGDKHLDFIEASSVWLGDGTGNFTRGASLHLNGALLYTSLIVADFNRDGKLDVIESSNHTPNSPASEGDIEFFAGNGDGTFALPLTLRPFGTDTYWDLAAADFNGDGKLDFAFSHAAQAAISLGNGDGTFQANANQLIYPPQGGPPSLYPTPSDKNTEAVADFDANGTPDIAIINPWLNRIFISLNDGTGTFSQASANFEGSVDPNTLTILTADLNGDGLPDLITLSYNTNNVRIFLSRIVKKTPTVTLTTSATQVLPGSTITLTAKVSGNGGTPTGAVTFADGATSLGQVALDGNGQATFTTSSLGAGQHSLTATYAGDARFNGAASSAIMTSVVDFALSLGTATQTISVGSTATYPLTLTGAGGLTGAVTLTCSGLPAGYSCSSTAVSLGGQPATATLSVAAATRAMVRPAGEPLALRSGIALAVLPLGFWLLVPGRRRGTGAGLCSAAVLACGCFWMSGCSGGSSSSNSPTSPTTPTAYRGTSNFTINAAVQVGAQTVTHQTTATLTVQ